MKKNKVTSMSVVSATALRFWNKTLSKLSAPKRNAVIAQLTALSDCDRRGVEDERQKARTEFFDKLFNLAFQKLGEFNKPMKPMSKREMKKLGVLFPYPLSTNDHQVKEGAKKCSIFQ